MRASSSRSVPQRRLMWLLWAACLLPIAQTAATWHALSLARADRADVRDTQLLHHTHCDFCLTAAALSGGVLPGQPPSPPRHVGHHEAPQAIASDIRFALAVWVYRSRAPPSAPH